MGAAFRPRINWPKHDLLLPPELFGIEVPPGLNSMNVRAPKFVNAAEMMQLARDTTPRSGALSLTEGLVTRDLKVTFPNPAALWRRSPMPGARDPNHGPFQFQFTGGDIFLDLSLGIYILKSGEPDPKDDLSVQIFAVLYSHELLHVLDDTDLINNWLIPQLNREPTVARYLIQAQPYTYGTTRQTAAELDFQQFIGNTIQTAIFNVWATESNRRGSLRDAPAQYQIVQDKVDELRAAQINRPHR